MKNKRRVFKALDALMCFATLSSVFILLNASGAYAENSAVDSVTVTIPVSCSITGTLGSAHTATTEIGTYTENIGETTFNVLCNDANGFAVYAVGFSDDTEGNTIMKPSVLPAVNGIATGTATSGNTSNWAMKLTAVSGTYEPTLETGFNNYHVVPSELTKVASLASNTDATSGSSFKSTYAVFVSQSQPADTYTGKVKYTVVHPASISTEDLSDAITFNFDGNGLSFLDGSEENAVQYVRTCDYETIYTGTAHQDVTSSNFDTNGNQTGSYTSGSDVLQTISYTGADKLKVVVDYGITESTAYLMATEGAWDGNWGNLSNEHKEIESDRNKTGTKTFFLNSDTTTILIQTYGTPEEDYGYGFFVKVYPVYTTEQSNTVEEDLPCNCQIRSISGSYEETTTWKGRWNLYIDGDLSASFSDEQDILNFILWNYDDLKGSSVTITAYNPVLLTYDGNGASNEFGMGIHEEGNPEFGEYEQKNIQSGDTVRLLAPNFKRQGYGFIGWSTTSNAINNLSSATIYGPNELVSIDDSFVNLKNEDNLITLYATWLPSAGNIQNWSGCSSMSAGSITALTDTRDNNTYAIAKLADGNCWMIENYRLGGSSPISLTLADTQTAGTLPAAGSPSDAGSTIYQYTPVVLAYNTISPDSIVTTDSDINYSFGNTYNFAAAINSTNQYYSLNTDIETSICPAGWSLPGKSDFQNLVNNVGSDSADYYYLFPYNFVNADYYSSGMNCSYSTKTTGSIWTNEKSIFQLISSSINPVGFRNTDKRNYNRIRCFTE